jgi:hypothetical protein
LAADENLLRMILSAFASLGTTDKEALPQELVELAKLLIKETVN